MSVREKAEKSYIRFIQRPNPNYGEAETSLNQLLKSVKDPNSAKDVDKRAIEANLLCTGYLGKGSKDLNLLIKNLLVILHKTGLAGKGEKDEKEKEGGKNKNDKGKESKDSDKSSDDKIVLATVLESIRFTSIVAECSTMLFNLASLYYSALKYTECNQITELLADDIVRTGNHPIGISIKAFFLLIEVKLKVRQYATNWWKNMDVNIWKTKMEQVVSFFEKDMLPAFARNMSKSKEEILLKHLINFRISVYRCRIETACHDFTAAIASIENAMELFANEIEPYVTQQLNVNNYSSLNRDKLDILNIVGFLDQLVSVDGIMPNPTATTSTNSKKGGNPTAIANDSTDIQAGIKRQYHLAICAKAHLDYVRGKLQQSIEDSLIFMKQSESMFHTRTVCYNNIAAVCMKNGNYNLAGLFFDIALQKEKSKPLYQGCLQQTVEADVIYNRGLAALHEGSFVTAYSYLEKTIPYFASRSKLWIRLSECCLGYATQSATLALEKGLESYNESRELNGIECSFNTLTYAAGRIHLSKALHLIRIERKEVEESMAASNNEKVYEHSLKLLRMEIQVLLKLAFACLCDEDPYGSMQYAAEVITKDATGVSGSQTTKDVAYSYIIECLCMTGQMFRARAMMEEHKSGLSSQQFSTILGTPDAVLKYKSNLPLDDAAVMIFEGNLEGAQRLLAEFIENNPQHAGAKLNMFYVLVRRHRFATAPPSFNTIF